MPHAIKNAEKMINANELRLNNLVQTEGGSTYEVTMYDFERIYDNEKKCFGIPLSEEWLLKFGFVDITPNQGIPYPTFEIFYTHVLVKSRIELQEIDTNMWMWLECNTNVHIYYVHQLQNLYYALTQTELELKK